MRDGRSVEAEEAMRAARAAMPATAASRAGLALRLSALTRPDAGLRPEAVRRAFDEADALTREAERLDANGPDAMEARAAWLMISAHLYETDSERAKAMTDRAQQLLQRAFELRQKGG
jgi:hypothetical protein